MQLIYNWITLFVWFYFHVQKTRDFRERLSGATETFSEFQRSFWYFTNCKSQTGVFKCFFFLFLFSVRLEREYFALHTLCHTKHTLGSSGSENYDLALRCVEAKPDHYLIFMSPIERSEDSGSSTRVWSTNNALVIVFGLNGISLRWDQYVF